MAALCAALMGAEYDEAWIIASARQAFNPDAVPQVVPVTTTGGVHFLIVGLTQGLIDNPFVVPRLVSLAAMAGLFWLIARALAPLVPNPVERRILLVTCLAAPGTMLLAGMGYGIALATLMFVAGMLVGLGQARVGPLGALLAGGLIGLAIATRWNLIPALPAVLFWVAYSRENRAANAIASVIAIATALAVFVAMMALHQSLLAGTGPNGHGASLATDLSSATGSGGKNIARLYSFFVRLAVTLPVVMVAAAWLALISARDDAHKRRLVAGLLGMAALIVAAWALKSPFMHLRYIWPAYLAIAMAAGLGFVVLYRMGQAAGQPALSGFAVAVPALMAAAQGWIALRVIAMGAAMQVNAAGYEHLENHFSPFYHLSEQRQIVATLRGLDPDAGIAGLGLPAEYGAIELALLSGRQVFALGPMSSHTAQTQPTHVLTHSLGGLNDAGQAWVETLGAPVASAGGYRLYALPQGTAIPDADSLAITPQLYRFTLERQATLTGH